MRIAIIGAGAAGLMCACMLPEHADVTVFDGNDTVGRKLLLTGKGRCNLTNLVSPAQFLRSVPRNAEFVSHAIHAFAPHDTVAFFNQLGLETVVENNNRVFPKSNKARDVVAVLETHARSRGIKFELGHTVTDIHLLMSEFDTVVVATGGMSFSGTGSTGDGFTFAHTLGHSILPTRPSLCGLQLATPTGFQGTSLTVSATLGPHTEVGDMMFTRNGVSGPVIHKLTSLFMDHEIRGQTLTIDLIPNIAKPQFNPADKPFYAFRKYVPQTIANWLTTLGHKPTNIKSIRIPIADFDPIDAATVTRGGVDITQIDPVTMQSRLIPNLYFIGEVLDVDALSGGFNLQIAFATAVACARSFN